MLWFPGQDANADKRNKIYAGRYWAKKVTKTQVKNERCR